MEDGEEGGEEGEGGVEGGRDGGGGGGDLKNSCQLPIQALYVQIHWAAKMW